ncbi:unnamed protein product [Owenia fusiformis]|uniref:DNA damage-binding protein 2 n=1 Tax=Owenia fusiformis TaxID=6347 RepID=A0A8J1U9H2_OWEFU|nr:unnamed protein product [Owenia fusiformis]
MAKGKTSDKNTPVPSVPTRASRRKRNVDVESPSLKASAPPKRKRQIAKDQNSNLTITNDNTSCVTKPSHADTDASTSTGSTLSPLDINTHGSNLVFPCSLHPRKSTYQFTCSTPSPRYQASCNSVIQHLFANRMGHGGKFNNLKKSAKSSIVQLVTDMQLYRTASPFDRRVTALEWHPNNPSMLAVGSKGGDIILWNVNELNQDTFVQGKGPGGSIQAMKFWPDDPKCLLTASIDGKIELHDFEGVQNKVFLDTMDLDHWFCGVDVNSQRKVLSAGDNKGNVTLMNTQGKKIWQSRLHKNKVTHVEFSPREDWLLCTASMDQTVQLWDLRMVKDRSSVLKVLPHSKGVNSAYFSPTDGKRLLCTDQHDELRVYGGPSWTLGTTISHPHRAFRHITPIKAQWHPLEDLIIVGRYPDPKFPGYTQGEKRTIDVFDADTGDVKCQLHDPGAPGIISLTKFNHQGDSLACGMGFNILLWNRREFVEEKQEKLMSQFNTHFNTNNDANNTSAPESTDNSGNSGGKTKGSKNTKTKKDKQTRADDAAVKAKIAKTKKK